MTPAEMVAKFMSALKADPDLAALAYMADVQVQMMGDKSALVTIFDRMAELWATARGGRFEIEVAA